MRKKTLQILSVSCILFSGILKADTYYVDSIGGNDTNSGTASGDAWQTLNKVNGMTFQPGDQILLKAGSVWAGQLNPKGSGSQQAPIKIDVYGEGDRPVINAGGVNTAGLLLQNVSYWEVSGLEITNTDGTDLDQGTLFGIYVLADGAEGTYRHIYIDDCYIHDVNGKVAGKRRGGIHVHVTGLNATIFDDLRITNNRVVRVGGVGIGNASSCGDIEFFNDYTVSHYLWTHVYVGGNYIDSSGRNCIIARVSKDAVYEHNVLANSSRYDTGHSIFCFDCDGMKIQYNEAYGNVGEEGQDRGGYDADYNCINTTIQYNYSHDNMWFCGIMKKNNRNVVIRYNISQNDKKGIYFYGFENNTEARDIHIYNNVHFVSDAYDVEVFPESRTPINTMFENNIFYFEGQGVWGPNAAGVNTVFRNNVYYNISPHVSSTDDIVGDPQFVNPGVAGTDIDLTTMSALEGYRLMPDSPCINSGLDIADNGGQDFWGDVVPYDGATDRGVHEYQYTGSDENPPTPDPAFSAPPEPTLCSSIEMVAVIGSDPSGPVEYLFTEVSGNPGGSSSDWQTSSSYIDTGLFPDIEYAYTVTMRDAIGNTTAPSAPVSAVAEVAVEVSGTIVSEGFEDCFTDWDSNAFCSAISYEGLKSCKMDENDYAERVVVTDGYSNIRISYARNTTDFLSGDFFVSEWFDGTAWHTIEEISSGYSGWGMSPEFTLPSGADNNSFFKVRFRVASAATNYAHVDAVTIEGSGGLCCNEREADFNCDQIVDVYDLLYMANAWLTNNLIVDLDQPADGVVNLQDLSILVQEWLQ